MTIDPMPLDSRDSPSDSDSDSDDSKRQSLSPKQAYSQVDNQGSVDNSPGHPAHQETLRPPQNSSLAFEPSSQIPNYLVPGAFHAVNASSSHTLDGTPQGPTPQPSPTVSPTAVDNPADMPSTSSPSLPASPATPSPISNSSTGLSAIQTVQSYLTHQAQEIQSHLTAALPDLIQGEVRTQCAQLAQEIGNQISLIREELIRPIGDQDDPMLPSSAEGERGERGEQSARCSRDNEAAETRRHHRHSQQPNSGDEADEEDEGGQNENNEDEISAGSRKYKKQAQALRVGIHSRSS